MIKRACATIRDLEEEVLILKAEIEKTQGDSARACEVLEAAIAKLEKELHLANKNLERAREGSASAKGDVCVQDALGCLWAAAWPILIKGLVLAMFVALGVWMQKRFDAI